MQPIIQIEAINRSVEVLKVGNREIETFNEAL